MGIKEHELFADGALIEGTVVIRISGRDWMDFKKSAQMTAMREYVAELTGKSEPDDQAEEEAYEPEEEDKSVTRMDLDDYVTWNDMSRQFIFIGGQIGRRDRILAAALAFALLALAVALRALYLA